MARDNVVARIVEVVAAADGVDQSELDPLYDHIDPDILRNLHDQEKGEWNFTFRYTDHQVTLTDDGQILIDGVSQPRDVV